MRRTRPIGSHESRTIIRALTAASLPQTCRRGLFPAPSPVSTVPPSWSSGAICSAPRTCARVSVCCVLIFRRRSRTTDDEDKGRGSTFSSRAGSVHSDVHSDVAIPDRSASDNNREKKETAVLQKKRFSRRCAITARSVASAHRIRNKRRVAGERERACGSAGGELLDTALFLESGTGCHTHTQGVCGACPNATETCGASPKEAPTNQ